MSLPSRKLHPLVLAIVPALLLSACASGPRPASLAVDSRLSGGSEAQATIQVPADWYQASKKADRLEFLGPDNFSRLVLHAQPVTAPESQCDALVLRAIGDFAAGQAGGKVVDVDVQPVEGQPGTADFSLMVPGAPAGPTDRVFTGRAMCRSGELAVASCAVGKYRRNLGEVCKQVVASLDIKEKTPAATAGGLGTSRPAPAPVPPASPQESALPESAPQTDDGQQSP